MKGHVIGQGELVAIYERTSKSKHRNRARGVDAVGVSDSRAMDREWH